MREYRRIELTLAAVAAALALSPAAHAQHPTPHPKPPPPSDDVPPPGLRARGAHGDPLILGNSGLKSGYARVGAGARMFGVCWNGGTGPFAVVLQDAAGRTVLNETGIDPALNELIKSSSPLLLRRGVYSLDVTDSVGQDAKGHFTVVAPSTLPPGATVSAAQAIASADVTLSYEAYLRVLPMARHAPQSDAAALVNQLCHQPPPPPR